ncbi:MAG: metallophosphoesterase [Fuscovulum sp.]|nr:MAG: metallophosphoesterase [Fuscovulum sp.]
MLKGLLRNFLDGRTSFFGGDESLRVCTLEVNGGATYIVGDVHGCLDELTELLRRIATDAAANALPYRVLLIGDVIDRGMNSAGVMDFLCSSTAENVMAILGNHEEMFLRFYDDPRSNIDWLDFGGFETLMSYGLALDRSALRKMSARRAKQVLETHIPYAHVAYLASLNHVVELVTQDGTFIVSHAGYDAERPIHAQSLKTLLWGKQTFDRSVGVRRVHGHVMVERTEITHTTIMVDTGCYRTGRLTALRVGSNMPLTLISNKDP